MKKLQIIVSALLISASGLNIQGAVPAQTTVTGAEPAQRTAGAVPAQTTVTGAVPAQTTVTGTQPVVVSFGQIGQAGAPGSTQAIVASTASGITSAGIESINTSLGGTIGQAGDPAQANVQMSPPITINDDAGNIIGMYQPSGKKTTEGYDYGTVYTLAVPYKSGTTPLSVVTSTSAMLGSVAGNNSLGGGTTLFYQYDNPTIAKALFNTSLSMTSSSEQRAQ